MPFGSSFVGIFMESSYRSPYRACRGGYEFYELKSNDHLILSAAAFNLGLHFTLAPYSFRPLPCLNVDHTPNPTLLAVSTILPAPV
jgi:hypothetical protein